MYQAYSLFTFLLTLTAAPLLATASPLNVQLPRSFDDVPRGTSALAFDPETGSVLAYSHNGSLLGHATQTAAPAKRAGGACSNLGPDDLKALGGWSLVEAQAKTNWGNGKYNLATNIDNQENYPAIGCVSADTAMVTVNGDPSCTTSTQSSSGTLVGTSGTVTLSALEGTSSSTTLTTTKTSEWSLGLSVAATIGIPDIVDTTTTVTTSVSITNSLSTAVTTTSSSQQTQTIAMAAADGASCSLTFDSKSCTGSGTGSIVMTATGWAWFEYANKVQGHYYWALNIESYITDASQRSSSIDFTAAISATNDSHYNGTCT
ncbi:hypothetical protein B0H17DRAFT_1208732 [Mycena rosella]|uniref:Uncharacterized protein n=1 Tax=Mycena rosella TaxID=1033263 RepID=A0AAD7D0H5_MYCRO|nr:hypothetical protein B0H17DRAFT_1208732 [Mycena rosella]